MLRQTPIRSGDWQSKGGSSLHLIIDENGRVKGNYATVHGRAAPDEIYPITGFVNGEMIGFVCSWGDHCSVSTWCGRWSQDENGDDCLNVVWHLGRQFADDAKTIPNQLTFTFHTNAGKFYRVNK
jgi:hypothetical protein